MRDHPLFNTAVLDTYTLITDDCAVFDYRYVINRIAGDLATLEYVRQKASYNSDPFADTHGAYPNSEHYEIAKEAVRYLQEHDLARLDGYTCHLELVLGTLGYLEGTPGMDRLGIYYLAQGDANEFVALIPRWQEVEGSE